MDALDPTRTAVVLIDLQRRIVDLPTAPHTGPEVVARCLALAEAARAAGGSELLPEVAPREGDVAVVKHTWGAFHETGLDAALRARGVDTLVIGGIATNFGVEQTALEEVDVAVVLQGVHVEQ